MEDLLACITYNYTFVSFIDLHLWNASLQLTHMLLALITLMNYDWVMRPVFFGSAKRMISWTSQKVRSLPWSSLIIWPSLAVEIMPSLSVSNTLKASISSSISSLVFWRIIMRSLNSSKSMAPSDLASTSLIRSWSSLSEGLVLSYCLMKFPSLSLVIWPSPLKSKKSKASLTAISPFNVIAPTCNSSVALLSLLRVLSLALRSGIWIFIFWAYFSTLLPAEAIFVAPRLVQP